MKASIVIPTFQRADLLDLGLRSLRWQETNIAHEIIVVNDGQEQDRTRAVCDKYGARYIFSGHRNTNGLKPRCPGFAINIGAKLATGDVLILTCPEVYHPHVDSLHKILTPLIHGDKRLTTPETVVDDFTGSVLAKARDFELTPAAWESEKRKFTEAKANGGPFMAHRDMPFFMGMQRGEFIAIGGYDEDFTGIAADDNDLVDRLRANGNSYYHVETEIVHLFHGLKNYNMQSDAYRHNVDLWQSRAGQLVRNDGREWGKL